MPSTRVQDKSFRQEFLGQALERWERGRKGILAGPGLRRNNFARYDRFMAYPRGVVGHHPWMRRPLLPDAKGLKGLRKDAPPPFTAMRLNE